MLYVNRGELHDGLVFKRCMSGGYIVLLCAVLFVFLFAMAPFSGLLTLPLWQNILLFIAAYVLFWLAHLFGKL